MRPTMKLTQLTQRLAYRTRRWALRGLTLNQIMFETQQLLSSVCQGATGFYITYEILCNNLWLMAVCFEHRL